MFGRRFQICPFFIKRFGKYWLSTKGKVYMFLNNWKKHKRGIITYLILAAVVVFLNVLAWQSNTFCDVYIKYVFPVWVNTYGRLTGLVSFSVGEIMLLLALIAAALWVLLLLGQGVMMIINVCGAKKVTSTRIGKAYGKVVSAYSVGALWITLVVCLIMTLNCFILYHASTFSERYYKETKENYSLEELITVRNYVVEQCNRLSLEMERDAEGNILYAGDIGQEAIAAMQNLGQTYDQLDGYYPRPKPLAASDFFSQQYICGYYFPFSMEANYNNVMYIMNYPFSICHELAHLRGYIYEDEANMIGYLACVKSGNLFFEYSGYLNVLYYLDNDFFDAIGGDINAYYAQPEILPQVHEDNIFLKQEDWDRIEEDAVVDTETVDAVSDAFTETVLVVNGVEDGILSYSRVVELLLLYYENEGFE